MQKVIAKIDLENIRYNARLFQRLGGGKLCCVVKANAYGHGAEEVTFALSELADMFAVAIVEEGIAIRTAACGKDILVFTPPVNEEEAYALLVNGFLVSVPNLYTAKLLCVVGEKYGLPVRVHLKGNTGMNRYGMNPSVLGKVCTYLRGKGVSVEGLYSHLYACDKEIATRQRHSFLQMQRIAKRYYPDVLCHLSATYGATLGKGFAFDMLRVGLGLYGYAPVPTLLPLKKAMQVECTVVENRRYSFGGAGYGKNPTLPLQKGEKLALCRVGYADGFLRKASNGTVGANTNVNNLCMDACIRKSSQGRGGCIPLLVDADETAEELGTLSYEVLCNATRRAEFIYE